MTTNELVLSSDLSTLTAEINAYKDIAGEALYQIGRRLKYVKEKDLTFGEFGTWAKREFGFTASMASNYIAAYEQFPELPTSANLGKAKVLELISLPSDVDRGKFVTSSHPIPSSGATKTVDEMTVRELREVKAALKAEREAREEAEARAQKAEDDYDVIRDTLDAVSTTYVDDGIYRINNQTEINGAALSFSDSTRDFIKEYAYLTNYCTEMATSSDESRLEYLSAIEALEDFVFKFKRSLSVLMADSATIIDIPNSKESVSYV